MSTSSIRIACLCASLLAVACSSGPRAVRGTDQELDDQALSTGLDRKDLQGMVKENMAALNDSAIMKELRDNATKIKLDERPGLAVLPMENETSEHIDGALSALVSDVETQFVEWGPVRVINVQSQQSLINQIRTEQASGSGFDTQKAAAMGKQIGAKFVVKSKVSSADERVEDQRRVQYFMFMQVLNVETGEILFQHKTNRTKAIIRD
jgi:penicillin-binding protein activator